MQALFRPLENCTPIRTWDSGQDANYIPCTIDSLKRARAVLPLRREKSGFLVPAVQGTGTSEAYRGPGQLPWQPYSRLSLTLPRPLPSIQGLLLVLRCAPSPPTPRRDPPEGVVVPHEPGALGGRQKRPVEEEAELGAAAEAEFIPDDADQVRDETHLTRLQEQPAQPTGRTSRGRVIEKQPQAKRRLAAAAGRRHLD